MITDDKITEIFCLADDFCKLYERMLVSDLKEKIPPALHHEPIVVKL